MPSADLYGLMEKQNQLNETLVPITIRLPKSGTACPYTGLRRSALNALILPTAANDYRPPVRSIVVKSHRYASRGVRLIVSESLREHLATLASDTTTA